MDKNISSDPVFMAKVFNAIPVPVFIADDDVKFLAMNSAARALIPVDVNPDMKRGGEALQCVHAPERGCGKGEFCKDCVVRLSVNTAIKEKKTVLFRRTHMKLLRDGKTVLANLLVTAASVSHDGRDLAILIIEDINSLIHLSRLLPMCANCKKIRDEKGTWESIEKFIEERVDVDFSHGLCPDCMKKMYGNNS